MSDKPVEDDMPAGGHPRARTRAREGNAERSDTPTAGASAETPVGAAAAGTSTLLQREAAVTIFERGAPGRRAFCCPPLDVPEVPVGEVLPKRLIRREPPRLPEVSEPEIVRHYVRLSKRNFDLDSGFYPLGSCTMKHNPRLHERVAALPGHARLHPLQDAEHAQGALELMWRLERALAEIAGLPHVCLQPSAGSHGELAGVLLTRAYHEARGEHRRKVLAPDTAHGTNPATVTMAGLEVVALATDRHGGVDLDDLRAKADADVACLMLTNPNTLGVFDRNIAEIAQIVHGAGAILYYDGANLNAVMGISRPGDMGFDIVHFNLHKSFTQPHGGGGPGSGPIAVSERIEPFLPIPAIVRRERWEGAGGAGAGSGLRSENGAAPGVRYELDEQRPQSIGRLRGFQGNYGCFVRAYAYICSLGAEGLRDVSEVAVLNANYLLARLRELGVTELLPLAYPKADAERPSPHPSQSPSPSPSPSSPRVDRGPAAGLCMHELVLSGAPMKRELQIKTLDLAKRLLDHGYHPPTVYFPLLVEEALMVEPTETETRETLDAFAQALAEILREAAEDPEIARNAPYTTPVRRLDEVGAAKRPVIRQAP
jgi:glycine cleavage system P protein (glycine dehydrogenase) subunit 2